jgi:hypothetical protein
MNFEMLKIQKIAKKKQHKKTKKKQSHDRDEETV